MSFVTRGTECEENTMSFGGVLRVLQWLKILDYDNGNDKREFFYSFEMARGSMIGEEVVN